MSWSWHFIMPRLWAALWMVKSSSTKIHLPRLERHISGAHGSIVLVAHQTCVIVRGLQAPSMADTPQWARLLATVGKYVFTIGADDTVFVHMYISCSAKLVLSNSDTVTVTMTTNGPWEGGAQIRIEGPETHRVKFSFRKPRGATNFAVGNLPDMHALY